MDTDNQKFILTVDDGYELSVTVWDKTSEPPKGIVLIIHGMSECAGRYGDFAKRLNNAGYTVAGLDLRGHGLTDKDNLGKTDKNHFENSMSDIEAFIEKMTVEHPGVPLFILAHDYGAFLVQGLIKNGYKNTSPLNGAPPLEKRGIISGFILTGTTYAKDIRFWAGRKISYFKATKKGGNREGQHFVRAYRGYDLMFHEGINGWLSRDVEEVGRFNAGEMTGFACDNNFFRSYFVGLKRLVKGKYRKAFADVPLLILGGDKDCLSWFGRGVKKLCKVCLKKGFGRAEYRLYKKARHDLLFERNKEEIAVDIVKWIGAKSCFYVTTCIDISNI